ncbi:MAG: uracil-DNA glycosylase [Oscillospiraceae bacterium]|nr:uracil-DNA glycosylase [Oscillospiraceae bacterium]
MQRLPHGWDALLGAEWDRPYFEALSANVAGAYAEQTVFPPAEDLFSAFSLTPPEQVRVVIFGQDPYHEPNQAHGLAFSVQKGIKMPPSLRNIEKELMEDVGIEPFSCGCLTSWAQQGVFLLNTVLTVESGKANSHKKFGWQTFTDAVVQTLADLPQPIAFVLWGAQAQAKAAVCEKSQYPRLVLQSAHPSPLSSYRGFFGSKPFSKINEFLRQHGEKPIDWQI